MSYDLRRRRLHGLIRRIPGTHRYTVTDHGFCLAVFLTWVHKRLVRTGLADILDQADPDTPLRREPNRIDLTIERIARKDRLIA